MVLAGTFFAYIVPIILMFLGYDTLGCVGAVFGFLLPFIIFKFVNKKLEKKFMPNITEIEIPVGKNLDLKAFFGVFKKK